MRAEQASLVPHLVRQRLGSFEMADLAALNEADWLRALRDPKPAHRMPETMAVVLLRAVQRIGDRYGGDTVRIWSDAPSSATLVRRFLEFHRAGPKIATMAANILAREFHVRLGDYRYVDISADVQVRRVMARLGFVEEGASPDVASSTTRRSSNASRRSSAGSSTRLVSQMVPPRPPLPRPSGRRRWRPRAAWRHATERAPDAGGVVSGLPPVRRRPDPVPLGGRGASPPPDEAG